MEYKQAEQNKGFFISLEGGEGAGKTSVITYVEEFFSTRGNNVILTREPGGISIAEQIRAVILDMGNTAMDGRTEALLYAAARRQHLVEKVKPALDKGCIVICDRFIDSSLAYQGHARGIGLDDIYNLNLFAIEDLLPDLTLWLDVEPEVGIARINANKDREFNRLDAEALDFHKRVQEGYQLLYQRFPERIVRIDANKTPEEVQESVKEVLLTYSL